MNFAPAEKTPRESEEVERALRTAVDLSDKTGSELHVVHVGALVVRAGASLGGRGALPDAQDALDREARRSLEAEVEKVEDVEAVVLETDSSFSVVRSSSSVSGSALSNIFARSSEDRSG